MADGFCIEGWNFALKGGIRDFDAWENHSRSGLLRTVFVNLGREAKSVSRTNPSPVEASNERNRFDKGAGSASSFALFASFQLKEANMGRTMVP